MIQAYSGGGKSGGGSFEIETRLHKGEDRDLQRSGKSGGGSFEIEISILPPPAGVDVAVARAVVAHLRLKCSIPDVNRDIVSVARAGGGSFKLK